MILYYVIKLHHLKKIRKSKNKEIIEIVDNDKFFYSRNLITFPN